MLNGRRGQAFVEVLVWSSLIAFTVLFMGLLFRKSYERYRGELGRSSLVMEPRDSGELSL